MVRHFLRKGYIVNVRNFVCALVAFAMAGVTAAAAQQHQTGRSAVPDRRPATGLIGPLGPIATIGSAVDPLDGDQNPYGLAIAPAGAGNIAAGDLVICNFNDGLNIQGLGTTIEVLKPRAGETPRRLIADPRLTGCAAIAMGAAAPWATAYDANVAPIVSPGGALVTALKDFSWQGTWGEAFVAGPKSAPAFYVSNANDGRIVRIDLGATFTYDTIVTGLPLNHGVPGSILAPSGLTYDAQRDVLYVVDGAVDTVAATHGPATIPNGGIAVRGRNVEGRYANRIDVLYSGAPLNAPVSAALLFNGDLVAGNTGDNRLIELSPDGRVAGSRNLDAGPSGALFGIAAFGTSAATTQIF